MDKENLYVHDAYIAMAERDTKRWFIICILLFFALIITNGGWLYRESQFETVEETTIEANQEVETGEGDAAIYDGVTIDGASEAER
jgi:hypothetical protein